MPHQSTATGKKSSAKSVASKPAAVKSTAKKPSVKRVRAEPSGAGQIAVNDDDRRNMIATAAYYRAERRGFNGGCETEDWLEAEAEIDAMLYH